MLSNRKA